MSAGSNETFAELVDRCGVQEPMRFEHGEWWISRAELPISNRGHVSILLIDGTNRIDLIGKPDQLRRLAEAITAQVEAAEANTPLAPEDWGNP